MNRFALAVVTSLLLVSATAHAAGDEDITRAREQFAAGLKLEDAGKWPAALEAFRAVATVRSTPQVRYHVGLCLEHTGHLIEAAAEMTKAEAEAKESTDPEQQLVSARAGQRAAIIRAKTPRIEIAEAARASAIRIDGAPQQALDASRTVAVDPGTHRVELERDGRIVATQSIVAQERDPAQVIIVGGVAAPIETASSKRDGGSGPGPTPWIAGGIAVVALAGAGGSALLRSSALDDLDAACGPNRKTCPESSRDTHDNAETYTTLTNVFLITAAASAVTAGVLWLVLRPSASPSSAVSTSLLRGTF